MDTYTHKRREWIRKRKAKRITYDALTIALGVIATLIALDALAFMLWIASGQTPVGDFYAGGFTAKVLQFIL